MRMKSWSVVDAYAAEHLLADIDPIFASVLAANAAAGLPAIDVSPLQGKFLNLVVRMTGARKILEIGTLGGYSTIWMGRALPENGRIISLECAQTHARIARQNVENAGLSSKIDVRTGAALESLPTLAAEGAGPFDLVFIDADKPNNPGYLDWAVRLSRPGATIILDNVIRDGHVADTNSSDHNVRGAQAAFELIRDHKRIDSTALQTVGIKGYDGFIIGIVRPA
jgi:predicted O-methyltransferase YrrM